MEAAIMHFIIWYAGTVIVGVIIGICILAKYLNSVARKKVEELDDCPFPFKLEESAGDTYIIFDMGNDTALWCQYNFGLRSDGVFGVAELTLRGINTKFGGPIQLAIGQSVFPLIEKMNQFDMWAKAKAFEYEWEADFEDSWKEMKKKLDNLRFLESKSKEKDKKPK